MAKGNNGISTLVRRRNRLLKTALVLAVVYYGSRAVLSRIFDVGSRNKPQRSLIRNNYISALRRSHILQEPRSIGDVLDDYLTLVDINIAEVKDEAGSSPPYKVRATFCQIDWDLQHENPSTVPMFRDLRQQSKECSGTHIVLDLYKIVTKARIKDGVRADAIGIPKGVVFHETRCGSTLTANLLASLSGSTDVPTRVYSESPPPVTALRACRGIAQCSSPNQMQLVRDVFYMMGRVPPSDEVAGSKSKSTPTPSPQVFYKFQSITSHHIRAFAEVFPEVPWVYLYRDSVEVMMSHWKVEKVRHTPICARSYRSALSLQPAVTMQIVKTHTPSKKVSDLTMHEYCAAHLAGLSMSIINEHDRTGRGRFVNYRQLPDIMWETILPNDFGMEVSDKMRSGMQKVATVYSKGRGVTANLEWREDSEHKRATADSKVTNAVKLYMDDVYGRMEKLAAAS